MKTLLRRAGSLQRESARRIPADHAAPTVTTEITQRGTDTPLLKRDLRASLWDMAGYSVMVGSGETYFPAFILALGLGQIAAGLVASVPLVIGGFVQMLAPWANRRFGSNRRWVIFCVSVQAASFIPLIVMALRQQSLGWLAFASVSLYWAAGQASSPAWNAWMETVVPVERRARFFAVRSRIGQAATLLGFLIGGLTLHYGKINGYALWAFAGIFAISCLCRAASAWQLYCQSEDQSVRHVQRLVGFGELCSRMARGGTERMLLYFLAVQTAVQVSGPYFTPYMLGQLKLSYLQFVSLIAVSFAAKVMVMPLMGRIAHRYGTRRLLWIGGIGIVPVSGLWLYCETMSQFLVLQFVAGMVWAAYELAMALMFFESVKAHERSSIMTYFNLANGLALALGSALGYFVLKGLGAGPGAYLTIFAISSLGRAIALICFRMTPEHSRTVQSTEPTLANSPVPAPIWKPAPLVAK